MPVVTPSAASIEIVKFVVWRTSVLLTINGRRSCSHRARVSVRQINPRPYFAMKLMSSARTFVAAHDEIAFVLALLVVEDHDHLAGANRRDDLLGRVHLRPGFIGRVRSHVSSSSR